MTKLATIKELNERFTTLSNSVSSQVRTLRHSFSQMLGISPDGKRDLYDIYKYPRSLDGVNGYRLMRQYARREGISNRITAGMASSCWRDGFEVYDSPNVKAKRVFENEVLALQKSGFIRKIEAADTLNRIGRMAVLYVGVPDGRQPHEPIGKVARGEQFLDKLYFVAYGYDGIEISGQVSDVTDPRFGLPEYYTLQKIGEGEEKGAQATSIKAHWSRVIHLNESSLESDIEGMGALEPVFNRILDIDKATGGAAEAYFRNAKGKIAYEIGKDFASALLDETNKQKFQEGAEKYTNEFQDHTVALGATAKTLPTPHASPLDTIKVALWAISGYTGIPIRVLTGEGAGQLAGSEDQLALNQIIRDRQRTVCAPWIERLFTILSTAGMIKLPESYEIVFPVQEAATEEQKARNGDIKAGAIEKLTRALSTPAGAGIDIQTAFAECGLEDIKVTDVDIDELDKEVDQSLAAEDE